MSYKDPRLWALMSEKLKKDENKKTKIKDYLFKQLNINAWQTMNQNIGRIVDHRKDLN